MTRLLFALFIILNVSTYGQGFSLFNINSSNFPAMKASFIAVDATGRKINNLSFSEFEINEDGITKPVTNVSCPADKPTNSISSVLVMDVSGSMFGPRLAIAKAAAQAWIDMLDFSTSECAITSFSNENYINQDFTISKTKLVRGINSLECIGGTDYNSALISPMAGGLLIAKTGKNKRVIVFLSDGGPNFEPEVTKIINQALADKISIYCVTIDMPAPQCMKDFSAQTGGLYFENIRTKEEAEACYRNILLSAQGSEPCTIEWNSASSCQTGLVNGSIKLKPLNLSQNYQFYKSFSNISKLEIIPSTIFFENSIPGKQVDTTIKVTARNSNYTVINVKSSNPAFTIDSTHFALLKDQTLSLKISYIPADSGYAYSKFTFESDLPCPTLYYASGGFKGIIPKFPTLKVTSPNGGEEFAVGVDTLITWEGLPESEPVRLDYSNDSGKTWNNIVENAKGLQYQWQNIPKPTSQKCFVRATQTGRDSVQQILWQKCYGGTEHDVCNSLIATQDGGFVIVGSTNSTNGDITGNHGKFDAIVIKCDSLGKIEWQKCYGGSNNDFGLNIISTIDKGYLFSVSTNSTEMGMSHNGDFDEWIVKLDSSGKIMWADAYNAENLDILNSLAQTSDGIYYMAGFTASNFNNHNGDDDVWVVKCNSNGLSIWNKCFGGSKKDRAISILATDDGGSIFLATTASNDFDVEGNHGLEDLWLVKLNSDGDIEWKKCFGGTGSDSATSLICDKEGGYVLTGVVHSNDGDVQNTGSPAWIVKLDKNGIIKWQTGFGKAENDYINSIVQTDDNGFLIAGTNKQSTGNLNDCWIVKFNNSGILEWEKSIGGSNSEDAFKVIKTTDKNYIFAGSTASNDGDISGNHGTDDAWVIKLSPTGSVLQKDESDSTFSIVAPMALARDVDMGYSLVGTAKDSVIMNFISNVSSYKCRVNSIYFTGKDSLAFGLVGGYPKYDIAVKSSNLAEFVFVPNRVGLHTAEIVIVTQSDTIRYKITGMGVEPQLQLICNSLDFGDVEVGSDKEITDRVIIKNISANPVNIDNTVNMANYLNQFEIKNGGGSFTLAPNQERQMTIKYSPKLSGRTTGRIGFEYKGIGSPLITTLYGRGLGGEVTIPFDSAYSGEKREIRLVMKHIKPEGLKTLAQKYSATLRFQGRILAPQDFSTIQSFQNDTIIMKVAGDLPDSTTLITIPVIAGLGNVDQTKVDISYFRLTDASGAPVDYDIDEEDGNFKLLGVCRDGGARYINPNSQAQINAIRPNPATNEIKIEFQLSEKGGAEFQIVNDLGVVVKQISYGEISDFTQRTESIKLDDLANGSYTLILKTPTLLERHPLLIIK